MLWMILNSLVGVEYEIAKRLTDANFEVYLPRRRKLVKPRYTSRRYRTGGLPAGVARPFKRGPSRCSRERSLSS
jgi:hypothetical protein